MVHTLKGTAATLGVERLAELAAQLEKILQKEQAEPLCCDDIRAEMDDVSREISALAAALPAVPMVHEGGRQSGIAPADQEAALKLLQELRALLAQSDTAVLTLLDEHAVLLRSALGTEFEQLAGHIRKFEFDKAHDILQALPENQRGGRA